MKSRQQNQVGVGIIGSQFISTIHAEALKTVADAVVLAVISPNEEHVKTFAEHHKIPNWFTDIDAFLAMDEIDMVILGVPNHLHCELAVKIARAKKHVVVEKPLCLSLEEADIMIETCKKNQVKLMYAEELCFAPKYVRLKSLLDEGALGYPVLFKQSEKHDGPHAAHFYDVEKSGGGVMMDMGCHAIQFFRWLNPEASIVSVYSHMQTAVHKDKTIGDDNSVLILEFSNGVTAIAEESWIKKGGMDDKAEIHGSEGVAYADVLQGNSILTYSEKGIGYAVEKAGNTKGWSFTMYEELWNYGFPQEMAHFVDCVKNDLTPLVTGEDGRAVLEVLFAAYASAGEGKKIMMPFKTDAKKPYLLWKK